MQILTDPMKQFIIKRMALRYPPDFIALLMPANFHTKVEVEQVLACWRDHNTRPTQTAPVQIEDSPQMSLDEDKESDGTRSVPDAPQVELSAPPPDAFETVNDRAPVVAEAHDPATLPTRTGPGQNEKSIASLTQVAAKLMAREGYVPAGEPSPTLTGPLQNQDSKAAPVKLTDEVKTFIVKALACYDTPSQVAEAVKVNFGLEVSRQQVHTYDPASAQPPAQRWRDLHAATRQAFLADVADIGIAHKSVRLRMLDRFARGAEARNAPFHAAEFMVQAAKECGGIYEKRWVMKARPPETN